MAELKDALAQAREERAARLKAWLEKKEAANKAAAVVVPLPKG